MRTLQLIGNSGYGGGTYLVLKWCRYLVERGCQVDVLGTDPTTVRLLREIPGVQVIDSIYIPRDITPVADLRAFFQLISYLHKKQYEVIHTYTATPGFLGRITARLIGTPVIVHHQAGWVVTEFSSPLERILYTPLLNLAAFASTKTICVSHATAHQARQYHVAPAHKLVTICNGIDPQPLISAAQNGVGKALRHELGIPAHYMLIGSTGRLAPSKEYDTLIQAMVSLKSLIPNVPFMLLLAGDGPDLQKLKGLIHDLGLGEQVRLLGFRGDIPAFLGALDIFVSPSRWEGLSISLLEAMAAGRPIVTTSILPNAELIEPEVTGLLVPIKSPESIARAIARFVQEPELAQRCASTARQRVLEYYSIDRMFEETWNLYVDLLKAKRPEKVSV
ncbi:MAG: glycosyltransferase family 4 protein [Anaerolineae bacterium]|nr:glycosyltransferase family 4 protein [Anaerolineae bacterium]